MLAPEATARTSAFDIDLEELARVSTELESKPAGAAIKWAWERFGTGVFVAASFQDTVLIDVAVKAVPEIDRLSRPTAPDPERLVPFAQCCPRPGASIQIQYFRATNL